MQHNTPHNIEWAFEVRRKFSWFVEYFQIIGTNRKAFSKVLGVNFGYANIRKDGEYNEFYDKAESDRALAIIKEKTKRDFNFLKGLAKKSYAKSRKLLSLAEKIPSKRYNKLSDSELRTLFDQLATELKEYQPVIFFVFPVEKYLEDALEKKIRTIAKTKKSKRDLPEYLSIFSMPKKELIMIQEEKSILRMAISKKSGNEIGPAVTEHIQKYAWIPTDDPAGKPWKKAEIIERINSFQSSNPQKQLEEIEQGQKSREKKLTQYQKELELDAKTIELIQQVREFVYLRNYRVECWVQAQFLVRPFFQYIAEKAHLRLDELMAMNADEISHFLDTGKVVSKKEINERMHGYAYTKLNEKYKVTFGETAEKMTHRKEEIKQSSPGTQIRGTIANKGKVIGTVKVVRSISDLPHVQKGDILVASMTLPQYIPAMEKAAAFVTDEGGITSHAAIISRELNVPCIIGTKNATKRFKDGDTVEVNANKGIVKLLSGRKIRD